MKRIVADKRMALSSILYHCANGDRSDLFLGTKQCVNEEIYRYDHVTRQYCAYHQYRRVLCSCALSTGMVQINYHNNIVTVTVYVLLICGAGK